MLMVRQPTLFCLLLGLASAVLVLNRPPSSPTSQHEVLDTLQRFLPLLLIPHLCDTIHICIFTDRDPVLLRHCGHSSAARKDPGTPPASCRAEPLLVLLSILTINHHTRNGTTQ